MGALPLFDIYALLASNVGITNIQRGVTLIASVLRSATAVKTKVSSQIEIFAIVNGQATISLDIFDKIGQGQGKFRS